MNKIPESGLSQELQDKINSTTPTQRVSEVFTAEEGQDTFVLSDYSFIKGVGRTEVYLNGLQQSIQAGHYTEGNDGKTITLSSPATAGMLVEIRIIIGAFPIGNADGNNEDLLTDDKSTKVAAINELFYKTYSKEVNVIEYDNLKIAMANGYDYTPVIQAAVDEAQRRESCVKIPSYVDKFTCYSTITIDVSKTSVMGESAHLDFTNLTSGVAVNFVGYELPPYGKSIKSVSGLHVYGGVMRENYTRDTVGLKLDVGISPNYTAGTINSVSNIEFSHIDVEGFGTGVYFGKNAYLVNFYRCEIHHCGTGVYSPSVSDDDTNRNYGENMTLDSCALYGNDLAAHIRADASTYFFHKCSFDYNVKDGLFEKSANVTLVTCFIETRYRDATVARFTDKEFAVTTFNGCYFYIVSESGEAPQIPTYFENSSVYSMKINHCNFRGIKTSTNRLATGYVIARDNTYQYTDYLQLSDNANCSLFPNTSTLGNIGAFANLWVADSSAVTSQHVTNDTEVSLDTVNQYNSKPTIKITKKNSGTNQKAFIYITPDKFQATSAEFYVNLTSGTGDVTISTRFATVKDKMLEYTAGKFMLMPNVFNQGFVASINLTQTQLTGKWNLCQLAKFLRVSPQYNSIVLEINLANLSAGSTLNIGGLTATQL